MLWPPAFTDAAWWALLAQERMANNHVYVFRKSQPSKYAYVAECRYVCVSGGGAGWVGGGGVRACVGVGGARTSASWRRFGFCWLNLPPTQHSSCTPHCAALCPTQVCR